MDRWKSKEDPTAPAVVGVVLVIDPVTPYTVPQLLLSLMFNAELGDLGYGIIGALKSDCLSVNPLSVSC